MSEKTDQSPLEPSRAGFFARMKVYWMGGYRGIQITRYDLASSKLSGSLPIRISMVSDIHADTRFMPLARIKQVVDETNALEPDIVLLGGDLSAQRNFSMKPLPLKDTVAALSRLKARLGVYAVMGNHDWWDDVETQIRNAGPPQTAKLLKEAGIHVLSNEAINLDQISDFWLAGLESQMAFERGPGAHIGADNLEATLEVVPNNAFTLLLAHEPDIFAELGPDSPVDLVVSGHTHGGQIRVFGTTPVVPSKYGSRYAYGHVRHGQRDLIVSGGWGAPNTLCVLASCPKLF